MEGDRASINGLRLMTDSPGPADLETVWDRVEEIVDRAPTVQSLGTHRLHLVAARVWRSRGVELPAVLEAEERQAALIAMATPPLLERACAAYGGRLMLMKGAEVAAHYRHPSDRFFCDLDLLADDASAAQRALIEAGFVQCGDPATYHHPLHLCPLVWPGVPLFIEVHCRPSSPRWLTAAPVDQILDHAVPSATGVGGLLAPDPVEHALLLVAHSWSEAPLSRLADLVDVMAVLGADGRRRADDLARLWGWEGIWDVTLRAADAVLGDAGWPASLNVWARHLMHARDRTVLENHLARIAAPASALPGSLALVGLASALKLTATRRDDERWSHKLRRSGLAMAHAFMATSSHDRSLTQRQPAHPYQANSRSRARLRRL